MDNIQYPQDTSVDQSLSSVLGVWQNMQIILGQQIQRYIQSVNTKNKNKGRGVSISDINGLLDFLESTINNTLSVSLNQTISISKLRTQQNRKNNLNQKSMHKLIKESVKRVLNEYKNKDTERFNTTGKKYDRHDSEMLDKESSRLNNRLRDGKNRYFYHNNDVAKGLAIHGRGQQRYDEYDIDEPDYYDVDDEQWLHDHPVDQRGYLYQRNEIPTFDGGIERGTLSDFR